MKKRKAQGLCLAALLLCLFLTGCGAPQPGTERMLSVCLEMGRGFVARSYLFEIDEPQDVIFQLQLQQNYEITGCSYPDYTVTEGKSGFTLLTLQKVQYPCRVTVTCQIPTTVILYDPNGGSYAGSGSGEVLRMAYGPSVHPRLNTLGGQDAPVRQGYVLIGWNTLPDGSGTHIGLGSRVTAEMNRTLTLYAQWEQQTDAELFRWQEMEDGILLTGYLGSDAEKLVLPAQVDGKSVTAIADGFARGIALDQLVIPDSVLRIEDGAFRDCSIEEIWFSDTLKQVSDAAFENSRPRYWHISAVLAPRYQAVSDITAFADKMDLLMLHENEKKLLLFSGCSMNYGVDSDALQESYPDYTVLNLGAVGGTNAQFQLECILPYVHSGDVFLHAPEQASGYQLMSDTDCENRMFIAIEGNFDLLAGVDMTTLGAGAFDCFQDFNYKRSTMEPCTYEDQYIPLNGHGDNSRQRIANNKTRFDENYRLCTEYITDTSLELLCSYYDRIQTAGGRVVLSYAPISALCCTDEEVAAFAQSWEQGMLTRGYRTVSTLSDYVLEPKYFYDSDYHLTDRGAELRTAQLIADLAFLSGTAE